MPWHIPALTTQVHEAISDIAVGAPVHGARVSRAVVCRGYNAVLAKARLDNLRDVRLGSEAQFANDRSGEKAWATRIEANLFYPEFAEDDVVNDDGWLDVGKAIAIGKLNDGDATGRQLFER